MVKARKQGWLKQRKSGIHFPPRNDYRKAYLSLQVSGNSAGPSSAGDDDLTLANQGASAPSLRERPYLKQESENQGNRIVNVNELLSVISGMHLELKEHDRNCQDLKLTICRDEGRPRFQN